MCEMSFVVARMQKLKADNLIGLGNHDQRKTANHSNQDIDVSRSHLNYDLVAGRTQNFKTDIQNYIDNRKASQRAVRKDAVLANEWVITSDKSFFEQLDEKQTRTYFETAKQYFADKFGDENIRYAIVQGTPQEWKTWLGAPESYTYGRLKDKILNKAIEEINLEIEDMDLSLFQARRGRSVVQVEVHNNFIRNRLY